MTLRIAYTLALGATLLSALGGCATTQYRYLPGGKEASAFCGKQASGTWESRLWGGLAYDQWRTVYEACMTEHGFPPGAPVREKVGS